MCGIYGILTRDQSSSPNPFLLSRMGGVITHRGPDDEGRYLGRGVGLGMRRLSIIDLAGGHQPIANEDETVWVVCNGEIYNFHELRQRLEQKGHRFRTRTDTEVLVHLYEEEGLDFVRHLRGMFAIALWDANRARLVLVRDRLGKKPLYIREEPNRLLFGSEIKSLLEADDVPRRVDLEALGEYLALGYVPAPRTMFEGIRKLLPGHLLVAEKGRIIEREYWDVRFDQQEKQSEQEWVERVRVKFLESVRIRLVSDVPLGAFLSGGIDSSAVVAAMAQASDRPVKTYSIGFEGEDRFYNELPYASLIAREFATDHHEIIVRPEVSELLPRLIWHLDEPIADSAFITTYLVSRLARESVTVILSGVGGDELFGGYRRYLGDSLMRYYRLLPKALRSTVVPALLARLPQDRRAGWKNNVRYAAAFANAAELGPVSRYLSYVQVFSPEARAQLLNGNASFAGEQAASRAVRQCFDRCPGTDGLHQIIYADIKTSLADDLLALTDKMSMAASIECRAPFMDHELLELTARMPSSLKVRGLTMKYLLKKVIAPWLPREIIHRKKRGFGAPVGSWLRGELESLVDETLSELQVRRRGFFQWEAVQSVITSHHRQKMDHTDGLLALICFELWCRIFLDGRDWQQTTDALHAHAGLR